MKKNVVITITSTDRPGIVRGITEMLLQYGANLEESRMARLGGEFAGIMLVSVDQEKLAGLESALAGLNDPALQVAYKITVEEEAVRPAGTVPHEILVSGADHEGIVHGIAQHLADRGANIEELSTDVLNAPITGTLLFSMRVVVAVPASIGTHALREDLMRIAEEQGVDVEVKLLVG